jgi:multidrug resistance efflux pump
VLAFDHSMRLIERDGFGRWYIGLAATVLLFGGWTTWAFLADVGIVLKSEEARLEVAQPSAPLVAIADGRVAPTSARVGQTVAEGELLVELETTGEHLRLREARARLGSLALQVEQARRAVLALHQAKREGVRAADAELMEGHARHGVAEAQRLLHEREASSLERLLPGDLSDLELARVRAELEKHRATARAELFDVHRRQWMNKSFRSESELRNAELQRTAALLEGELESVKLEAARIEQDIEHRMIRAPVTGRIAELVPLAPGVMLRAGERIGVILPAGEMKSVAWFQPGAAIGRLRRGQAGRIRFAAFPWAQFGTISATVTQVADEIRDGRLRVELALRPDPASRIPLQHGMTGTLEVEVERISPAEVLLRAAGQLVAERHAGSDRG